MVKFDQKLSILVVIFDFLDQIRQFSIKFDDFWYKFEFKIAIRHEFWIKIVKTIDQTGKFGSKKLIKSWLEYDLDRILAGGWSNRISLVLNKNNLNQLFFVPDVWFDGMPVWSFDEVLFRFRFRFDKDFQHMSIGNVKKSGSTAF